MESHEVFDAEIIEYERFGATPVSVGEQVFLYRRLQDSFDKTLVAVLNEDNNPVGYLDRNIAVGRILPGLKSGVRFQVTISGEPVNGKVPVQVRMVEQAEVSAILAKRTTRSERATFSPLAGIFGEEEEVEDGSDVEVEPSEDLEEGFDLGEVEEIEEPLGVDLDAPADEDGEKDDDI